MRILGIDPGLQITGYGCVHLDGHAEPTLIEAGILRFDPRLPIDARLRELHQDLCGLIQQLRPTRVVVEKLYAHYAHPTTAIKMGHARGVILLAARQHDVAVEELAATEIKKAMTGNGHATKRQMQLAVQAQCGLDEPPSPPDVADAIAAAYTFARRHANYLAAR